MKRLLVVIIVSATLWSGYWLYGSSTTRGAFEGWFAERRAAGDTGHGHEQPRRRVVAVSREFVLAVRATAHHPGVVTAVDEHARPGQPAVAGVERRHLVAVAA